MAKTPTRNASTTLVDQLSESDDRCKSFHQFFLLQKNNNIYVFV